MPFVWQEQVRAVIASALTAYTNVAGVLTANANVTVRGRAHGAGAVVVGSWPDASSARDLDSDRRAV